MAHERTPRPVSGEIMAAASFDEGRPRRAAQSADIVDADYEVMRADKAAAPAQERAAEAVAPGGMEMLRKVATGTQPQVTARGGPLFWAFGIGIAFAAFWTSGGHALVRNSTLFSGPQQAKAAFSVAGVSSRFDMSGAKPVLLVDGEAANEGSETGVLPPLEIRVAAADGRVTRYRLGTLGHILAPGESFAFSSRLDVPKNGVGTVTVAFAQ